MKWQAIVSLIVASPLLIVGVVGVLILVLGVTVGATVEHLLRGERPPFDIVKSLWNALR